MSGAEPTRPPEDLLLREAATWFARMRGPDAAESKEAFEAWLRRGALHRMAYNRAAEIFADGKAALKPRRRLRPAFLLLPAALLAMVCFVILRPFHISSNGIADNRSGQPDSSAGSRAIALATANGEIRTFNLADGSRVTLQGGSILEVRFGPAERRLELSRGRVRFAVFHERRPFVVYAGGGNVTARGTLFDVALDERRRVTVKLIEGTIDVSLPPSLPRKPLQPVRRLRPGMELSFAAAQGPAARQASPPSSSAGSPRLDTPEAAHDFQSIAVADLVDAANRRAFPPLRLEDEEIGRLRVSGRFRTDDTFLLADRLGALFNLRVDRSHPGQILLRRP